MRSFAFCPLYTVFVSKYDLSLNPFDWRYHDKELSQILFFSLAADDGSTALVELLKPSETVAFSHSQFKPERSTNVGEQSELLC